MGEKAGEMYRTLIHDERPVTSIPYYVRLNEFFEVPVSNIPTNGKPLDFVVSCQMIHRKGIDVLLKACKQIKDLNWRLTLVGNGPLRPQLQRKFRLCFTHDKVIFSGAIPYEKRHEAFAGHHVFVFPSRWDGWGMVVPEALAAGLPVVATDQVISAHEFIKNGVNGFIIPAEDPRVLADKMKYFIDYPEVIPQMSSEARNALENYKADIGAEKLVRFTADIVRNADSSHKKNMQDATQDSLNWGTLTAPVSATKLIMKKIRHHAKNAVILTGNSLRINPKTKGNRILVYHLVLREDCKLFEEHIKFLKDNFVMTSVTEVLRTASEAKDKDAYRVAITFDDGFRIVMSDCLEMLNKYEIKATFFVPTGFVELFDVPDLAARFSLRAHYYNLPLEPMRPQDLQLLTKMGHEVESHGVSHISMSAMSMQQAFRELEESKQRIVEWTGITPKAFAYPYGHTSNVIGNPKDWLRESGYSLGLTLRRGKISDQTDPFIAARDHVEGNWPISYLKYFLLS
jgi:peptidoglycan/xylan/chitin deacetylase (PgdA/CDA1 family)